MVYVRTYRAFLIIPDCVIMYQSENFEKGKGSEAGEGFET
jgi:hypothetical protein